MVGLCLFASGRPLSASEQNPTAVLQPPRAAAPAGTEVQISSEEAVRMALENNLGIRAERLSPQLQALALSQTRASYVPNLISGFSKGSSTTPPEDFLTGSANVLTTGGLRTNGGVQQYLKWGGGRYQLTLDGARNTTSNKSSVYNPKLSSNLNFNYTQPLLRNFTIDSTRQQILVGQKEQEIVDLQLKQQVTQTARAVRSAYYDLVGAIGQLDVAKKSLDLANQSLKNNERRVEVGTLAQIDIVEAQAEVSRQEEAVILYEAQIRSVEDNLRTLIMNPSQPDFWTTRIVPSEPPVVTERPIDLDAAIQSALANRTDLAQARRQMEQTDITMKFIRNQKLPSVDMITSYNVVGLGGTQSEFDYEAGVIPYPILKQTQRSFSDALRDVFGNNFKTWSLTFSVSYPIGRSPADAALAQSRLQREQQVTNLRALELQVTGSVREAARQVDTSLKRVEATRKALEFAQKRYEAEEKRMTVGLSTTFQLFQAQRDLASQKLAELNAIIAYSRALVNFEAVQLVPVGGR
ncbi:MAG: hypothetical protein A3H96_18540 [Acidobacteria bacterium RIFCSPLOWO2_02_FULL_67_36]|nr:MAG: hypothetical protein A3H96_18540 [Acidobacteria bacterium RIFCSPLOWO2_02_FULL_67_36]OFW19084.1 MAG: hypothetical protein A3G21_05160 [Acidobacteria bacterium RIFCSPLOWO2_12_FULL_66_21]